jgi:hypothetical protein
MLLSLSSDVRFWAATVPVRCICAAALQAVAIALYLPARDLNTL